MTVDQIYTRSLRFEAVEASSDGRTIEGYTSVWDQVERIRDWEGEFDERFARGSFLRTLEERGPARIRMQFDHGFDAAVGSLPIGVWERMAEDDHGLYVQGRLLDSWHVAPVQAAIEARAIDGMSIRFRPVVEERDDSGTVPLVTHREVKLLEAGPVVWPAYTGTEVGVRSHADLLAYFRSMMTGDTFDLSASRGMVGVPPSEKDEAVRQSPVTLAERRKRAAELRGMTREATGAAASAAS